MTDVDWVGRVADALKQLDKEFAKNELAYLALTSKAEKQIVDRLAFSLHRDYGSNDDVAIAREYTLPTALVKRYSIPKKITRVDLTIVQDRIPRLFLEAKAMQSLNVNLPNGSRKYHTKIEEDKKKLREFKSERLPEPLDKVVLHLVTHPSAAPNETWDSIIKYSGRIRNYRPKSIDDLKEKLSKQLSSRSFPICACGDIPAGLAFNIKVTIHFRLFGPY